MAHQRAANCGKELPVVRGISAEIGGSPPKSMEAQGAVLCLLPFPSVIGHHSG